MPVLGGAAARPARPAGRSGPAPQFRVTANGDAPGANPAVAPVTCFSTATEPRRGVIVLTTLTWTAPWRDRERHRVVPVPLGTPLTVNCDRVPPEGRLVGRGTVDLLDGALGAGRHVAPAKLCAVGEMRTVGEPPPQVTSNPNVVARRVAAVLARARTTLVTLNTPVSCWMRLVDGHGDRGGALVTTTSWAGRRSGGSHTQDGSSALGGAVSVAGSSVTVHAEPRSRSATWPSRPGQQGDASRTGASLP